MEHARPSRFPSDRVGHAISPLRRPTHTHRRRTQTATRTMPANRALRFLRPLLTQPRRPCSSCAGRETPPACPPCESAPPPPCRGSTNAPLQGQRVVCCPPPQGQRPPCLKAEPECARTCEHQLPRKEHVKKTAGPKKLCGAARDAVTQRLRDNEEYRRRLYERAAAERTASSPKKPIPPAYHIQPATKYAVATDGRSYAVVSDAPAPRCPAMSSHCSVSHPPPQPVTLAPLGDCRPKDHPVIDPCGSKPRTILTIDRGDPECEAKSESPKPVHENPKNDKSCYKGITSRIIDSLRSGRDKQPDWCGKPPPAASPTPNCRPPTIKDRIRRKSPGKRHFHTSAADLTAKDAPKTTGREALKAASKKLSAVLSERDLLKEAGRGRVVRSPSCAPPKPPTPPPKPRENGGAMEFSIPAGADTVCVRVSMGKASPLVPPRPSSCPPPSCSLPRPPQTSSDSWLSIKKLQEKISSCGRSETPTAPETPKTPAPIKPKPPAPCAPKGKVKMNDILPHTIFVK